MTVTVSQNSLSEMERMCLLLMWMDEEPLLVTKLLMGFGDFVRNRYGSFSICYNHIISNGDGASAPAGRLPVTLELD